MTVVELNGFDESGTIGENLRFIRVGLDVHDELRPFIYNLLHFGSVIMTKRMLKGQTIDVKKKYVSAVFNDPAISINHYAFHPAKQLQLLKSLVVSEFYFIAMRRRELIEEYDSPDIKKTVSQTIDSLRKYLYPWQYIESFIKSYGYRVIIEDLVKTSKVLSDFSQEDFKAFSFVDGGYPFVFWGKDFLIAESKKGGRFSPSKTPIFGITHGDQYYPVISLAGNIASITNSVPGMIFPQSVKEIPSTSERILFDKYSLHFSKNCDRPRFFPRILFFGHINLNLQFLIPFIYCKQTNNQIWEPFRVTKSFKSFYKRFKGHSTNDIIVRGKIRADTHEDATMNKECADYGLKVIDAQQFLDPFEKLLEKIVEEAEQTNLGGPTLYKIKTRISRIKESVKKSL